MTSPAADAGHVCYYMQYLKKNLKPNVEDWVKRVLTTPLDMFLNFLFGSGYCPGGMGEQQVKLATSPGEPLHRAPIQKQCALTGTDPGLVFNTLKDSSHYDRKSYNEDLKEDELVEVLSGLCELNGSLG